MQLDPPLSGGEARRRFRRVLVWSGLTLLAAPGHGPRHGHRQPRPRARLLAGPAPDPADAVQPTRRAPMPW
jgi:hypothetical protein